MPRPENDPFFCPACGWNKEIDPTDLAERREWTRDEIDLARDNEVKRARDVAKRTAQNAQRVAADLQREFNDGMFIGGQNG